MLLRVFPLAGVGFDNTKVEIVADPVETRISHKILAHGKFGRLRAEVENMPNPNNPQSSYMASLSAIAVLKKIITSYTNSLNKCQTATL